MISNNNPVFHQAVASINHIRQYAAEAEQAKKLHPQQLQLIYNHNWFNLFLPPSLGGHGMQLPEAVRMLEIFARADASFGWTVTLCSGANWFGGFMDQSLVASLFRDREVCFSGSGASSGRAVLTDNGYIVRGKWKYATGAPHATAYTANCVVEKNGSPLLQEDGSPLIKTFVFTKQEVEIAETWSAMGMKATASHSFSVKECKLPISRTFEIKPEQAILPDLIFRIPFQSFAEITLAANFSGIATHFVEACKDVYEERIKRHAYAIDETCEMLDLLGRTRSKLEDIQAVFFSAVEKAWLRSSKSNRWDSKDIETLKHVCRTMVKQARYTVNELHPYCGMVAADESSELNRIWRDFHTASLHAIFTFGCG